MSNNYPIRIVYLPKKNSSATLKDGEILLRISKYLNAAEREKHIHSLTMSMERRLAKRPGNHSPWQIPITDGQLFHSLGEKYMLHVSQKKTLQIARITIRQQACFISVPDLNLTHRQEVMLSARLRRQLAKKHAAWLNTHIQKLNEQTVQSTKLATARWKEQSARWGSCTSKGVINIASRLMFPEQKLLDYVCVHELCHLVHANHGKRFWQLVARHVPDYSARIEKLGRYM